MTGLHPGAVAPDFELRDQHGQRVVLSQVLERARVALVFFPAAFSGVCGSELRELQEWWTGADRPAEVELLAVSCDQMFSLRGYAEREGLDFPLLSDFWPHGGVAQAYAVLDAGSGTARRSTYVVQRDGSISWAVHNPSAQARSLEDLEQALCVPRA